MGKMLTVGFDFEDSFYYSIILVKERLGETEYKITVMNRSLELLLKGNNIMIEKEGRLNITLPESNKIKALKLTIGNALGLLLGLPLQLASQ